MDPNPLKECSVCNEDFDTRSKCPRTLPCSHYLCSQCLQALIDADKRKCPTCRDDFSATRVEDVMINRAVIEFLNFLASAHPQNKGTKNATSSLSILKEDTAEQIKWLMRTCESTKAEGQGSFGTIRGLLKDIQFVNDKMKELTLNLSLVEEKNSKVKANLENLEVALTTTFQDITHNEDTLRATMERLDITKNFEETGALLDEVKGVQSSVEALTKTVKSKEIEELLKGFVKVIASRKSKICKILKDVESLGIGSATGTSTGSATPSDVSSDQDDFVKVEDLMELADEGRLFAVHKNQGKTKYARVTVRGRRLLLHHLTEVELPSSGVIVQHSKLMDLANPSSFIAFIDLSTTSSDIGSLFIDLSPDTPGARQFVYLCTGQLGPTYANTRVLSVFKKDSPEEGVYFGDYENQNGSGGKALVTDLGPGDQYKRQHVKGAVSGVGWLKGNGNISSQFIIRLRENPGKLKGAIFGNVIEGLDTLITAVNDFEDIKKVSISDCGIVLAEKGS